MGELRSGAQPHLAARQISPNLERRAALTAIGLARMYVDDPRFAATYDDIEPGLARYVSEAILALYPSDSTESTEPDDSTESHGSSGS